MWTPPHIHGGIKSVTFGVRDSAENLKGSYAKITSQSQLSAGVPVAGGVYDPHLGTFDMKYDCATCGGRKGICLGHRGCIDLGLARVYSPMYIKNIIKWLKVICPKCYRIAYSNEEIDKIPLLQRLDRLSKVTAASEKEGEISKLKPCVHCGAERFSVKKVKDDKSAIGWVVGKKQVDRIATRQADFIFGNVAKKDVEYLGQKYGPWQYILSSIPISAVTARPETRAMESGRVRINDQTFFMKAIVVDLETNKDNDKTLNQHYYEMIYGPAFPPKANQSRNQPKAIKTLIPGKTTGLIRNNLLGKRTHGSTRLVINGDSSLEATQVGIPKNEARKLSVPEIVDISNRDRLMIYFINARNDYPGCRKIVKADGTEYLVEYGLNKVTLEIGDTIWRDVINGDDFIINRAPSLLPSSEVAMKAVIHNDNTMKFNVFNCPLFNADFDGDAMTGYNMQSDGAKIEAAIVSGVDQFMIGHKNSSALLGQVQDSIIGLAQLSRSRVRYSKLAAMRTIGRTKLNPRLVLDEYTGRELLSMALEGDDINVNFTRKPNIFKEDSHIPYIAPLYKKSEKEVVIENGRLLSGILDKTSIAGGASSGLYHVIYSQYGAKKSLDALFNMQQLAIGHLQREELTVSYGDLLQDRGAGVLAPINLDGIIEADIPDRRVENIPSIEELVKLLDIENEKQIDLLDAGNILAPIGQTIEDHFRNIQINLSRGLNSTEHMMNSINPIMNNFYKMISYGSKGKFPNLQLMMEIIGLVLINEKMPSDKFGYKRTLPYFRKCELSLPSRGFVRNSYVSGMNVHEVFFNAMAERHSIIMKALFTAVIGAESRTAGKNLEAVIINNLRQTNNGGLILQPIYGGDGVDTRRLIQVKFPTLLISDEDFNSDWGDYGEYSDLVREDRRILRESFITLYRAGNFGIMSGNIMSPIDVQRIIDDVILKAKSAAQNEEEAKAVEKKEEKIVKDDEEVETKVKVEVKEAEVKQEKKKIVKDEKLTKNIQRVVDYTKNEIIYVMMNETAKKMEAKVPMYLQTAVVLYACLTRAVLKPSVLEKLSAEQLEEILNKITFQYKNALIDYGMSIGLIASQCTSEPLTQYVLHSIHHAVSGGTRKGGVAKFKEITSPKEISRKDAIMTIYVERSYLDENGPSSARWIATNIQLLQLKEFVSFVDLAEEMHYGKVIHPKILADVEIFRDFAKYYPLITPPANLIKWFFRFTLNREKLLLKNITMLKIVDSLRKIYPHSFIIHTNENAQLKGRANLIVRMYWMANKFKTYPEKNTMDTVLHEVLETNIRGIEMISNAIVEKEDMPYLEIAPAGHPKAGAIIKERKEPIINTNGSNIYGILKSSMGKYIDSLRITTDSIMEIWEMFGIEEAKMAILEELRKITPETNPRHLMIYAAEMCSSGVVTSIERSGLRARQINNILLRIAHQSPIQSLVYASENNIRAPINSVSGALIVGQVPKIGTHHNEICINERFVYHHAVSAEDELEALGDI